VASTAHFGDESRLSQVASFLAHAVIYVLPVAVALRVASWFGLLTYINFVCVVALMTCWYASLFHRRTNHLCFRCMDDVPADAPVLVERRRLPLRFTHFVATPLGIICAIAAFTAPLLGAAFSPHIARPMFIPADLWIFALIYAEWVHHRLRPWCPYCKPWDDFGDREPAPDPTVHNVQR